MTKEEWRIYNAGKQREYRRKRGLKKTWTRVEEVLKSAGHCSYCGCLLSSEWHGRNLLIGCQKAMQ